MGGPGNTCWLGQCPYIHQNGKWCRYYWKG
jgi:hypothetical protein